jgi:hypothetical protein
MNGGGKLITTEKWNQAVRTGPENPGQTRDEIPAGWQLVPI